MDEIFKEGSTKVQGGDQTALDAVYGHLEVKPDVDVGTVKQILSERVEAVNDNAIREAIDKALFSQALSDLDPEAKSILEQALPEFLDTLISSPEYDRLIMETKGAIEGLGEDMTVGEAYDAGMKYVAQLGPKLLEFAMTEFTPAVLIPQLTSFLGSHPSVLSKIGDYVGSLITDILGNLVIKSWTGSEVSQLPNAVSLLLTMFAQAMGDSWGPFVDGVVLSGAVAGNFFAGGSPIISAIFTAADQLGWFTSHGGPFSVISQEYGGTEYLGFDFKGITLMFSTQPNLRQPAVVAITGNSVPGKPAKFVKRFSSSLSSVGQRIISSINAGKRREEIAPNIAGYSRWLSNALSAMGIQLDYTLRQQVNELTESFADYIFTMKQDRPVDLPPIIDEPDSPEYQPPASDQNVVEPSGVQELTPVIPEVQTLPDQRKKLAARGALYPRFTAEWDE